MKIKIVIFLFLHIAFLYIACDLYKIVEEDEKRICHLPTIEFAKIDIPIKIIQSTDSMAQRAVELTGFLNSINDYVLLLNIPKDSIDCGPPWEKKWTDDSGELVEVCLLYDNEENEYDWLLTRQGEDTTTGYYFNSWNEIHASLSSDQTLTIRVIDMISFWYIFRASFTSSESYMSYHIRCLNTDLPDHIYFSHDEKSMFVEENGFEYNANLLFYEYSLQYNIYWNTNGNGYWQILDENNEVIDSGNW